MKVYPYPKSIERPDGGFTFEDIKSGHHWLRADVQCEKCLYVQSLAMAGSVDNGKCIRCGGKTS